MNKKLTGAPLVPVKERNYKEKSCKVCGNYFKPILPYQKYCSDESRQMGYEANIKANSKKQIAKDHEKIVAYNMKHHFCPLCGKPLESRVQRVHFDCMLKKWIEGDRSKKTKRWFYNRGYTLDEVNELVEQMG